MGVCIRLLLYLLVSDSLALNLIVQCCYNQQHMDMHDEAEGYAFMRFSCYTMRHSILCSWRFITYFLFFRVLSCQSDQISDCLSAYQSLWVAYGLVLSSSGGYLSYRNPL